MKPRTVNSMPSLSAYALALMWREREAKGFADILPADTFRPIVSRRRFVHLVRGRASWYGAATCLLTTGKTFADLDYAEFPKENNREGMALGVMRVHFADRSRHEIAFVEWAPQRSAHFERVRVDPSLEPWPEPPKYKPVRGLTNGKLRRVRERPGQSRFRAHLMIAYSSSCCVSGCNVDVALDGAHIDPYENPTQDSPQNGLLLRKDIHALFDANLLSVDPRSRRIILAANIRNSVDYAHFHGTPLRLPSDGLQRYSPDSKALARRFRLFEG